MSLFMDVGLSALALIFLLAGLSNPFEVDKRGKYFIRASLIILIIVVIDVLFKLTD